MRNRPQAPVMAADLGQRLVQQKVAQAKRSWGLGSPTHTA